MLELTDKQCNEFRRKPLTFDGMVRDIFDAGVKAGKACVDADAERYRYLRNNTSIMTFEQQTWVTSHKLDMRVDEALGKGK